MQLASQTEFDGQGYTITMTGTFSGLFKAPRTSSERTRNIISNLGVLGGNISENGGAIFKVNSFYYTVDNCYSTSTIGLYAGGIVSQNSRYSLIKNCYSTGDIGQFAGGIAGFNAGKASICIIENCYSTGVIGPYAGGIVGHKAAQDNNGKCQIENCYSTGDISSYGGGIAGHGAGWQGGKCSITNCYSTGSIEEHSGGITGGSAGYTGECTITNCYSTGSIGKYAGGITGRGSADSNGSCSVLYCYSTGDIGQYAGGILGSLTKPGSSATSCYSTGDISVNDAGGIAGATSPNCTITNCYSKQVVLTTRTSKDGDYTLPTISNIQDQNADVDMINVMDSSGDYYVIDNVEPKFYPLLKVFAEQVPSPYGIQMNYNMELADVYGCMDEEYAEYNGAATADDASCLTKLGCTNPRAANYNVDAGQDDGSCSYINESGEAPNFTGYDETTGTLSLVSLNA
jgi:hypothetical protein